MPREMFLNRKNICNGHMAKIEKDLLKDMHALLHPIRFRIVELVAKKPMYINEISKALGEERRLVSHSGGA